MFVWNMDSFMLVTFWVLMGAMMNMFILGVVMAVIFGRGYARLREEGGRGLIIKIIFWYGPSDVWLSPHLASCNREYVGG